MWPGTAVYPARAGRVVRLARDRPNRPGWFTGNFVEVAHDDGTKAFYAHLEGNSIAVEVGSAVTATQPIARSGISGRTVYPHLHFHLTGSDGTSLPARFEDVPDGTPNLLDTVCASDR